MDFRKWLLKRREELTLLLCGSILLVSSASGTAVVPFS